jgi:hypothetical protein
LVARRAAEIDRKSIVRKMLCARTTVDSIVIVPESPVNRGPAA